MPSAFYWPQLVPCAPAGLRRQLTSSLGAMAIIACNHPIKTRKLHVINEFHGSIEKLLTSRNLAFELNSTINPSAQMVYIQPHGLRLIVLTSALEDNSAEKVIDILAAQSNEWWLQNGEIMITAQLELKGM